MNLPKTSFAMVQTAPRRLEPRDIPLPELSDDAGLLRIDACGICGSDYEQFEGVLRTPMPAVPGHEPLGTVVSIGDRAARRWGVDVGDRIAVETMLSCRHCDACLGGSYHLCDTRRIYSYIPLSDEPGLWGSYSQYMYLDPNAVVHKVDPTLAPETAVMFNPLGAGFRWAVEIPETGPGDTVVIMGRDDDQCRHRRLLQIVQGDSCSEGADVLPEHHQDLPHRVRGPAQRALRHALIRSKDPGEDHQQEHR